VTEAEPKPPAPPPFNIPQGTEQPDEFAHIAGRGNRPPLLALVAVALALFLAVRLRQDVRYAFSSTVPVDLGQASRASQSSIEAWPLNRYVRLAGTPERESAVILDTRGSWKFSQFFRLRDTGGRVFVKRVADPLPVALAEQDRFTGRLLRFSDLSFADSISRHFASDVAATRFFQPEDLARPGTAPPPEAKLFVDLLRPGQYGVLLPRTRFPDAAAARQAIEGQGARVLGVLPEGQDADRLHLDIEVPEAGRARILSGIGDLDRAVRLRPARDTLEVTGSQLSFDGGNLVVSGAQPRTIPRPLVASIRTRGTVQIPADAVLLIEGERPRESWPSLIVLAFLLAFALVNLLGLRRPA
jgi:hypothetical protein